MIDSKPSASQPTNIWLKHSVRVFRAALSDLPSAILIGLAGLSVAVRLWLATR